MEQQDRESWPKEKVTKVTNNKQININRRGWRGDLAAEAWPTRAVVKLPDIPENGAARNHAVINT